MDKKNIINLINILKKYIDENDLKFIMDGINNFINYDRILIEYSIKYIYDNKEQKTEERILFGLKYNHDDYNKYFSFLNVNPVDIQNFNDNVYFSYDKSNKKKKIYFEKNNIGGFCIEYKNNIIETIKNYYAINNLPSHIYNYIPTSLTNIIKDNYVSILTFFNKDLHIYQFILKNVINYNDDFDCSVIGIAFDNIYNIKYHTYYLRSKNSLFSYTS
jgi:hypothetical protein